jgi:peptidase E
MTKFISLTNFRNGYDVSVRKDFILAELDWLFSKVSNPGEALFIPYAYKGTSYSAFFNDLQIIFDLRHLKLVDINDKNAGTPQDLIIKAKMYVFCGGDLAALLGGLNALKTAAFDPYKAIRTNVENGVPYLGWNEGSVIVSPLEYTFPNNTLLAALKVSDYQIIRNYSNSADVTNNPIKEFLSKNRGIRLAFAMVDTLKEDKTSVRLEESGAGMIYGIVGPVIKYYLNSSGQLITE